MRKYLLFLRVLRNSKEYSMKGTILTIRSHRTNETFKLDLEKLTKEDLERLTVVEE